MEKYITDGCGSVYRWSKEHQAYVFVGKLNGNPLKKFVRELEDGEYQETSHENK